MDKPLLLGYSALVLWATSATLMARLTNLPSSESLCIALTLACLASCVRMSIQRKWHHIPYRQWPYVLGILTGIACNHICYFTAFQYAPAVEIDLIAYSWPLLTFLCLIASKQIRFQWHYFVILLIGMSGLWLVSPSVYPTSGYDHPYYGWMLTLLGAFAWIVYSHCSQRLENAPIEIVGLGSGLAVICVLSTVDTSHWYTPNTTQWLLLIILGLSNATYAYWAWDWAIKQQQLPRLILFANTTPILSVWCLCLFGHTIWSWHIALASILLVISLILTQKTLAHRVH